MPASSAQSRALQAQRAALKEFQSRHSEEWQMLLQHFRVQHGLPAVSGIGLNAEQLQGRIERHERLLAKYQAQLNGVKEEA